MSKNNVHEQLHGKIRGTLHASYFFGGEFFMNTREMARCQGLTKLPLVVPDGMNESHLAGAIGNAWSVGVVTRLLRRLLRAVDLADFAEDIDGTESDDEPDVL